MTTQTAGAMHPAWRAFLDSLHAKYENGQVSDYGQPQAERRAAADGTILVDLSHLALVRGEGPDAETFLQGQFTNDIRQVSAARAQLSAYCNPKGRMFAIFLIVKIHDAYLLQLPAALAENTLKRLRMFVMRSKVKLETVSPDLLATGLSGPDAEVLLKAVLPAVPAAAYDTVSADGLTAVRLPGPQPRFEIIATAAKQIALWQALLAQGAKPAGAGAWSWLDIQAGLPMILPGTVEEFVPQMSNLDAINGVSFTKGCYPGQEIVARMHYLGRLKQRMVRMHADVAVPPSPGTPVYAPNFPDQAAGTVAVAEPSPHGGCDLLAVVQLSSIESGEIHLGSATGAVLRIESLPYELPADTKK